LYDHTFLAPKILAKFYRNCATGSAKKVSPIYSFCDVNNTKCTKSSVLIIGEQNVYYILTYYWNFAEIFNIRKKKFVSYRNISSYMYILDVLVQCRLATNGQTDGQTYGHTTTAYTALA